MPAEDDAVGNEPDSSSSVIIQPSFKSDKQSAAVNSCWDALVYTVSVHPLHALLSHSVICFVT